MENKLTEEEIKNADFVVLTKDVAIKGKERFKGKSIVKVTTGNAIKKSNAMVRKLEEHLANSKK